MADESALNNVYYETLLSDELLLFIDRRAAMTQKISKAFTSTPPCRNQHGSSIHTPLQVCFRDFTKTKRGTLEIPKHDQSVEVLKWIGFTNMAAIKIHRKHVMRTDGSRSFLDTVLRRVDITIKFGSSMDRSTQQIMDDIAITLELQAAIHDPWHTMIFDSQTLNYWINNSIRVNYRSFEMIMQRLNSQADLIHQGENRQCKAIIFAVHA